MIITTLGSDYWPLTPEGRVLCLLLAMYSFAVWGYITASLATFFLDRDAADSKASIASESSLELLRSDMAMLRAEVHALRQDSAEKRQ
jgi:voltage-gated potassium channel